MQNYYKLGNEVYYFDDTQQDLVTPHMRAMSEVEIDRHLNPVKYMTKAQQAEHKASNYKSITKLQLKLALLSDGLLSDFESSIAEIQDPMEKMKAEIIYSDSNSFMRLSDFITNTFSSLGLKPEDINSFWERAINI